MKVAKQITKRIRYVVSLERIFWFAWPNLRYKLAYSISRAGLLYKTSVSWCGGPFRSDNTLGLLLLPSYLDEVKSVADVICRDDERPLRIIDIGANVGQFSITLSAYLRSRGFVGKILSIEPNPQAFAMLQRNVSSSKNSHMFLPPLNVAIGQHSSTLTLHIVEGKSGQASFSAQSAVSNLIRDRIPQSIQVQVSPLTDDLMPHLWGEDEIDLVKIDVEGYEYEVLKGLLGIKSRFIWIETPFSNSGASRKEVASALALLDMEPCVSSSSGTLISSNGNVLYKRRV